MKTSDVEDDLVSLLLTVVALRNPRMQYGCGKRSIAKAVESGVNRVEREGLSVVEFLLTASKDVQLWLCMWLCLWLCCALLRVSVLLTYWLIHAARLQVQNLFDAGWLSHCGKNL